ncbi:hypothetical protein BpHYR1_006363 [Brachionus plicatilis]|uniref:Uncharacterized protein n=1 Tax=Brachionus plicatilis TaxID=10195 RepID=A0A3M7SAD5_BRAPC|nr:hypothetical protein BpHYR1_006363 [Brachionus plicatilis]
MFSVLRIVPVFLKPKSRRQCFWSSFRHSELFAELELEKSDSLICYRLNITIIQSPDLHLTCDLKDFFPGSDF